MGGDRGAAGTVEIRGVDAQAYAWVCLTARMETSE